ncbi:MAG: PAS domain S-box protein [Syntrophothermus sp.]
MEDVKTILLVEDEVIIALHTQRTLKKFGYSVLTALTGEQAVDIVRSSRENETIDLILMDIDLGAGIDGPEAALQILSSNSIPIVFHTSHSEREMVEKVRGITRYGYVIKNSGDFVLNSSIEMAFELFEANKKLKTELDEHIQTQAALAKSEEKFYKAFQASPNAIAFTTLDGGVYIDVNDAFLEMTGYTKDQIIGKRSIDIDIWTDLDERKKYIDLLQAQHTLRNFEAKFRMKDGHIGDYLVSTEVIELAGKNYGINYIVDISEQKAAEIELRDARTKLEEKNQQLTKTMHELNIILENAPVGISKIIDRKQHLVNRKTETLFQYPREDMEFQTTRMLYVSDEQYEKFGREAYPVLAKGEVFESVQELVRKDGQHIFVKYIGRAIDPADMAKGTIWILEDITDKKLSEEKIEMLLKEKKKGG